MRATHRPGHPPSVPARLLAGLVRAYQLVLSPVKKLLLGPYAGCRFHPTCSEYARQALLRHGAWRGGWLALRRLSRCHPWHPGGDDPVPGQEKAPPGAEPSSDAGNGGP